MKPNLDHPTLARIKQRFPGARLAASEFRAQTTLAVEAAQVREVLAFLRSEAGGGYDMLADLAGIDYLDYPAQRTLPEGHVAKGRFAVVYNLVSTSDNRRFFVKTMLDPSLDTRGAEEDPALRLPSVTDLWSGAEWMEREIFDMLGVRFTDHPDHRRILLWESYPAFPLRKDYPLVGRGEREQYRVIDRESA